MRALFDPEGYLERQEGAGVELAVLSNALMADTPGDELVEAQRQHHFLTDLVERFIEPRNRTIELKSEGETPRGLRASGLGAPGSFQTLSLLRFSASIAKARRSRRTPAN